MQIQELKNQIIGQQLQFKAQQFIATIQEQRRINDGKLTVMAAQVFKLQEEGKNVEAKQKIEAFRAAMELIRQENQAHDSQIKSIIELTKNEPESGNNLGNVPGLEVPPSDQDPYGEPQETPAGVPGQLG